MDEDEPHLDGTDAHGPALPNQPKINVSAVQADFHRIAMVLISLLGWVGYPV